MKTYLALMSSNLVDTPAWRSHDLTVDANDIKVVQAVSFNSSVIIIQTGLVDRYYYNVIHFVFCLSADEEEEVEKMCQSVISQMERTLGEPLQKYFWLSRRMYFTEKCCKPANVSLRDYKKWNKLHKSIMFCILL